MFLLIVYLVFLFLLLGYKESHKWYRELDGSQSLLTIPNTSEEFKSIGQ